LLLRDEVFEFDPTRRHGQASASSDVPIVGPEIRVPRLFPSPANGGVNPEIMKSADLATIDDWLDAQARTLQAGRVPRRFVWNPTLTILWS
jgi:hypothetical protein